MICLIFFFSIGFFLVIWIFNQIYRAFFCLFYSHNKKKDKFKLKTINKNMQMFNNLSLLFNDRSTKKNTSLLFLS